MLMWILLFNLLFSMYDVCVFQAGAHNAVHPGQPAGGVPGGAGPWPHQEPVPQVRNILMKGTVSRDF